MLYFVFFIIFVLFRGKNRYFPDDFEGNNLKSRSENEGILIKNSVATLLLIYKTAK